MHSLRARGRLSEANAYRDVGSRAMQDAKAGQFNHPWRHCEQSEAIQLTEYDKFFGLPRRFTPRKDN